MGTPSGWEDILDQGEVIIWQGRPDSTRIWYPVHYACLLLGLVISVFAIIWMNLLVQEGDWDWMYGILILCMGLLTMFGLPFGKPYLWSKSWYFLTNKRALITTDLPVLGRRLKSYPITSQTPLELEERYKTIVFFTTKTRRNSRGSYKVGVGFDRIDDANHVFQLMREIQKKATN